MDIQKAFLVIGLTIVVVILINVAIYQVLARRRNNSEIGFYSQIAKRARKPWEKEFNDLRELNQLVSHLNSQTTKLSEDIPEIPNTDQTQFNTNLEIDQHTNDR
jgi:hypothetical protein